MKLLSWNVNGLRSLYRANNWKWLLSGEFDVVCLQETKADPEQLPVELAQPQGFSSHFAASSIRKGYSGVATYTKTAPVREIEGLGKREFDEQGRTLTTIIDSLAVVNVYCPNGGSKTASLEYKLGYFDELLTHLETLRRERYQVVLGGDINVAHTSLDIARPEANKNSIGFLPIEREWIDELTALGYIDVFRHLNPRTRDVYTYWDQKTGARDRNVGWRIDYWFISPELLPFLRSFTTHTSIYGSDHCPIELELSF